MNFLAMIGIAMRLVTHYREIERLWPQIVQVSGDLQRLLPQVQSTFAASRELVSRIAPELTPLPTGRFDTPTFDARWLQQSLNHLMAAHLVVDGDIGEQTRQVITSFQRQHGLVPDGWAGIETMAKITELLEQQR